MDLTYKFFPPELVSPSSSVFHLNNYPQRFELWPKTSVNNDNQDPLGTTRTPQREKLSDSPILTLTSNLNSSPPILMDTEDRLGTCNFSQLESSKEQIFLKKVTHIDEDVGYLGEDTIFLTNVVGGEMLQLGDEGFTQAVEIRGMPYQWKCFRIQKVIDPHASRNKSQEVGVKQRKSQRMQISYDDIQKYQKKNQSHNKPTKLIQLHFPQLRKLRILQH